MSKINIGISYISNSQKFIDKIKADIHNPNYQIFIENGRKYDKITFLNIKTSETETKYFIERKTGDIYGAKSNTIPHLKWYYGNIENCEKWDWSGEYGGVSISDNSVVLEMEFKGYRHYKKVPHAK